MEHVTEPVITAIKGLMESSYVHGYDDAREDADNVKKYDIIGVLKSVMGEKR
jgi:hypothetical protein